MKTENEVLYHAISFFLHETEKCYLTKLLKLIYLFDLEHIRALGISATGKKYHAWGLGPVTRELYYSVHGDLDNGFDDFNANFGVEIKTFDNVEAYQLIPKFEFDSDVFSSYQLTLLKKLALQYKNALSKTLVDITHKKNDPWHVVFEIQGQRDAEIPMLLALNDLPEETKTMLTVRLASL